jgi:hypothetical protein
MVNNQPVGQGDGEDNLPPPPNLGPVIEELLRGANEGRLVQNQILQALNAAAQGQGGGGGGGNNNGGPQNKEHSAFMKTQPPIFRGSDEPLDADYWISAIQDKLGLFENTDEEKVTFATHQLQDAAGVCWRGYKAQLPVGHRITWDEFRKAFHDHHIPKSVLKLKKDEFCKLKQGNKSVQ